MTTIAINEAPAGRRPAVIDLEGAKVYTMRELNQRTADVIREINESGRPAMVTRHGRFIAMITPLAGAQVESLVLPEVAKEVADNDCVWSDENTVTSDQLLENLEKFS